MTTLACDRRDFVRKPPLLFVRFLTKVVSVLPIAALALITSCSKNLSDVTYEPLIVPPGQIRAVAMLEANCVSCSLKIIAPGKHTNSSTPIRYNIEFLAQMWCRDADPGPIVVAVFGTKIPPVLKKDLTAEEVIRELQIFVDNAIESRDPMDTGRWIIAAEAGHLLTQLKQTIKKSFGIMQNSSAAALEKIGRGGSHIVADILAFEAAAIKFDSVGQSIRQTVLKKEYYDRD